MILIYISVLVALIMINRYLFGASVKPTDVFNVIWCLFAGLASCGLFGFYETGVLVNCLVMTTVLFFNVAYIFVYCVKNKSGKRDFSVNSVSNDDSVVFLINDNVNLKLIYIANIGAWLFSFPYLKRSVAILFSEGMAALRMYTYTYGGEVIVASTNAQLFFTWVIQPVYAATMVIAVISTALSLRRRFVLLGISFVDVLLYIMLFGGRGIILKFLSFTVITILVVSGKKLWKFVVRHKGMVILALGTVLVVLWLVAVRSISGLSVFRNIYAYVAGPFVYLDRLLAEKSIEGIALWGSATLGCVISVFGIIGKLFFGVDFTAPENTIPSVTSAYLEIGENIKINSMTTMIYPFLLDYGYMGAVVGPLIFGVFVALIERNYRCVRSIMSLGIFIYVFHTVIFSVQNYTYFKMEALFIIVFIMLFTVSVKIKGGKMIVIC